MVKRSPDLKTPIKLGDAHKCLTQKLRQYLKIGTTRLAMHLAIQVSQYQKTAKILTLFYYPEPPGDQEHWVLLNQRC